MDDLHTLLATEALLRGSRICGENIDITVSSDTQGV